MKKPNDKMVFLLPKAENELPSIYDKLQNERDTPSPKSTEEESFVETVDAAFSSDSELESSDLRRYGFRETFEETAQFLIKEFYMKGQKVDKESVFFVLICKGRRKIVVGKI
jgi:hypothetical protein